MRHILAFLVLAALVGLVLPPGTYAAEPPPLLVTLSGPPALAPGGRAAYNVTIGGGPTGIPVNYTVVYYFTGANVTDASPTKTAPGRASGNQTRFSLNVTAPKQEQTLTLHAEVSAQSATFGTQSTTAEIPVVVVAPITLQATFHNAAATVATNVTVRFYIDNALVGTSKIASIPANGDGTATFQYLPVGLAEGQHSVRVEADLDGNGIIDASRGEVVVSEIFYRGVTPLSTGWVILIGLAVFAPTLLATIALRRRSRA